MNAPDISQIMSPVREALAAHAEAKHQVQLGLKELREQLRLRQIELEEELGVDALLKRVETETEAAREAAREAILAFAEAVWNGEAGEGTPVVLDIDGELRLAKVLDFTPRGRVKEEVEHNGYLFVREGIARLRTTGDWDFLSRLCPEEGVLHPRSGKIDPLNTNSWKPRLVEVAWSDPTPEELAELLARIKRSGKLLPEHMIQVFGSAASFEVGETFEIAESWGDHDRATLVAKIVFLPTSRWALATRYVWEEFEPVWRSHGVVDPKVRVTLDAKFREVNVEGQELQPLTEDEEAFLVEKFGQLAEDEE